MELVDKFDNKRLPLNKQTERYEKTKGEFNQSVHVWFLNSKNELLLQKRSETKRVYPGMWAITGGAVDSGELPIEALYREVKEELGITIFPEETELLMSLQRTYDFVDIYLVRKDFDIKDVTMQPEEVTEVKWVTINEFRTFLEENKLPPSNAFYSEFALKLIERRINNDWN